MREVAGKAAITVDPINADALGEAMRTLAEEQEFRIYRQQGLARASRFSWDKCVQHTNAVYKQLE